MSEAGEVEVNDTTDKDNKGSAFAKFKKILIGMVVATIAGAALYGAGWWQGRSQFSSDVLNRATNRAYLMEARGDLYDVTVNLDERNFGMANTRLQEAAAALGKIEDTDGNLNISKIQELQKAVAKKNINVAVNLEQQRNTVLSYINVLNKLIPAEGNLEIPTPEEAPQQ